MKLSPVILIALIFAILGLTKAHPQGFTNGFGKDIGKGKKNFGNGKDNGKGKNNFGNGKDNGKGNGDIAKGKNADIASEPLTAKEKTQVGKAGQDQFVCNGRSNLKPADGTQLKKPSCAKTQMGEIPAVGNMISSLILNPKNGATLDKNKPFNVDVVVNNLVTGFFSDPDIEYYKDAQTLQDGKVKGHSHVTVQLLQSDTSPPDAQVFAFFKGLNDKAKNGVLTTKVEKGLAPGNYRVCCMSSSFTHQPVIMPVAQRGSQDDCIRIKVK